jgi:hypothetical protein
MKIKISKSQWEKIGNETGWNMTIKKEAKKEKIKQNDSYNAYKSIRKPMPKPGYAMDDGLTNQHKIKDIGGEEDMASLDELKNEAAIACELKGHTLGNWKDFGYIATNVCQYCNKQIIINTRPKPNEMDISGEAIITNCSL